MSMTKDTSTMLTYFKHCKYTKEERVTSGVFELNGPRTSRGMSIKDEYAYKLAAMGYTKTSNTPNSRRKCLWPNKVFPIIDGWIEEGLKRNGYKKEKDVKSDTVVEPSKESPSATPENTDKLVAVLSRIADGIEALTKAWEAK